KEGDDLLATVSGNTRDPIAFFTSAGKVYVVKALDLPSGAGFGEALGHLFKLGDGERVVGAMNGAPTAPGERPEQGDLFAKRASTWEFLLATRQGAGFRTESLDVSEETTRAGRKLMNVKPGDGLAAVVLVAGGEIVLGLRDGRCLRIPVGEAPVLAGAGAGVKLVNVKGSEVVSAVTGGKKETIEVVPEEGPAKQVRIADLTSHHRGATGQKITRSIRDLRRPAGVEGASSCAGPERKRTVTIADNGRGIPVDIHPKTKKSAIETILTTLHAGGKFDSGAYHASGGLHGVGASVVCALSESLTATVWRDGKEYRQSFSRGKAAGPVKTIGPAKRRGTQVSFTPDPQIFPKTHFHWKTVLDQAEAKAFLNKGLSIVCENRELGEKETFQFAEGLRDYLDRLTRGQDPVSGIPFYVDREEPLKAEIALNWTPATDTRLLTYVNSIATVDGGSHEQALRAGLTAAVRGFMEKKNLLPKTVGTLTADDVTEGMVGAFALRIANPEFQGQTKEKLNNAEIVAPLTNLVKHAFETYLYENPTAADAVAGRIILAAQARVASRLAKEAVRKTGASSR
ncbi:MAG: hypothetical protein HYR98_01840, partial [Nitrospirae bacterium]|nr:hypothetical protein [Nitrospirota bacterium]